MRMAGVILPWGLGPSASPVQSNLAQVNTWFFPKKNDNSSRGSQLKIRGVIVYFEVIYSVWGTMPFGEKS